MLNTIMWIFAYILLWVLTLVLSAKLIMRISQLEPLWAVVERYGKTIIVAAISVSIISIAVAFSDSIFGFLSVGWKCAIIVLSAFSLAFVYPVFRYVDTLLGAIRACP